VNYTENPWVRILVNSNAYKIMLAVFIRWSAGHDANDKGTSPMNRINGKYSLDLREGNGRHK
jgi:hypothetical protein